MNSPALSVELHCLLLWSVLRKGVQEEETGVQEEERGVQCIEVWRSVE